MTSVWIGWFILAFGLSLVFTQLIFRIALRFNLVDRPDGKRKIHQTPIPLMGGLAIFLAIAGTMALILINGDALTSGEVGLGHYSGFLLGGLVLMFGGFVDDRYGLNPKVAFWFPVVAALLVIGFGVEVDKLTNPLGGVIELTSWQSDVLVFLWLMGVMYTTKFLDGVDGLATGVSAIGTFMICLLALTAAYYQPDVALLALVAVGALLGFLVWNFNPALIFLGEGGSTFVGYLLGTLAVISGGKLAIALLVIGIPALDVAWSIMRRWQSGGFKKIFQGDRQHLHHRLYDLGWNQRKVCLVYYGVAIMFGGGALFLQSGQKVIALGSLLVLMLVVAWSLTTLDRKHA